MTHTIKIGLKLLLYMRLVRPLLVFRVISFSIFSFRLRLSRRVATIFRYKIQPRQQIGCVIGDSQLKDRWRSKASKYVEMRTVGMSERFVGASNLWPFREHG